IATAIITTRSVNPDLRVGTPERNRGSSVQILIFFASACLFIPQKLYVLIVYPYPARVGFGLQRIVVFVIGYQMDDRGFDKTCWQEQDKFPGIVKGASPKRAFGYDILEMYASGQRPFFVQVICRHHILAAVQHFDPVLPPVDIENEPVYILFKRRFVVQVSYRSAQVPGSALYVDLCAAFNLRYGYKYESADQKNHDQEFYECKTAALPHYCIVRLEISSSDCCTASSPMEIIS